MSEQIDDSHRSSATASRPLDDRRVPPMAMVLGAGGLIPFFVCTAAIWTGWRPPLVAEPTTALIGYAAVILSFLGGVRWGLALRMHDPATRSLALAASVVPSIAAWLMLLVPVAHGLPALACMFLVLGILDARHPSDGAPAWYAKLRLLLTIVVAPLLAIAAAGVLRTP